jgi:hypothetical protein
MACVPLIGLSMAYAPAAGASDAPRYASLALVPHGVHQSSVQQQPGAGVQRAARPSRTAAAIAASRAELRRLDIGRHATAQGVAAARPDPVYGQDQVTSTNWSGFANDNRNSNTYTAIQATWTEPAITCPTQATSLAVFWVGIDGYISTSVEQDGSLAECYEGSAYYFTWWEMFPTNDVTVVGQAASPGDVITAAVVRTGTTYTLTVDDASDSADSFTTTQSCSPSTSTGECLNSSAEWIAEAPSDANGDIQPLADFRAWSVSNATVRSGSTSGVISTFPDDEITMVNGTTQIVEAQPTGLPSGGNAFTVYWGRPNPVLPGRLRPPGLEPGSPIPGRTPPPR